MMNCSLNTPDLWPILSKAEGDGVRWAYLLENDLEQVALLTQAMTVAGYRVQAWSRVDAFQAALAAPDTERPAVVVIEMELAEAEGSIGALIEACALGPKNGIPVVVVSANDSLQWRLRAVQSGVCRYVLKPLQTMVLVDVMHELVGHGSPITYRVLAVEDDALRLGTHAALLRDVGMDVLTLTQPILMLDYLKSFGPDVLILDIGMAWANGPDLVKVLRQQDAYRHLPIVFLSDQAQELGQASALSLDADDVLAKPVQPDHLVRIVTSRARQARRATTTTNLQHRQPSTPGELYRECTALNHHSIVSIADVHGNITYVNDKFCEISGYTRDELLRQNHRIIKSGEHPASFYEDLWHTITAGHVWQGDVCNRRKNGSPYWVASTISPVLDGEGSPQSYVSIRTDITELKAAEAALRAQNEMRLLVSTSANALLSSEVEALDETILQCLQDAAEYLHADRAYLFQHTADSAYMSNTHEWCARNIAPQKDHLQHLPTEAFDWWWRQMKDGAMINITDVGAMPPESAPEQALLQSQDIRALCAFPLRMHGKTVGFVGFDQVTHLHPWEQEFLVLLGLLADQLTSALRRSATERDLQRQREFSKNILDSVDAHIAVLDSQGIIVAVNENWQRYALQNAREAGQPTPKTDVGTNYLDVCTSAAHASSPSLDAKSGDRPAAQQVGEAIGAVMSGRQPFFSLEYPCHTPTHFDWFEMRVSPLVNEPGCVVVSHFRITDRKLTELRVAKVVDELSATLQSTSDGILAVNADGQVLFMNQQFRQMWGMPEELVDTASRSQLLAHALAQLVDPEEVMAHAQAIYQTSDTSNDLIELKDGRIFRRFSSPLRREGQVAGRVWSFHDTTVETRTEQKLKESNEWLHSVLENVPTMIFLKEANSLSFTYLNRAGEALLGLSRDVLIGRNDHDCFPSEQAASFIAKDRVVLAQSGVVDIAEEEITTPSGTRVLHTRKLALRDELGRSKYLLGISHDITERRLAEQTARIAEERLRLGQVFANIGTWEWNLLNDEIYWTERIAPMFGYPSGTLNTSYANFLAAVHPKDRQAVTDAVKSSLEGDVSFEIEHRVLWPDGAVRWLFERGAVQRGATGQPVKLIGVVQDITERKHTELALAERERQLLEAQRLASIGNWTADLINGELVWSDEIYRIFGREPGSFTPSEQAFYAAVHPDDVELVRTDVQRAEQTGHHDVVHRIVRPDGEVRHVHELARLHLDSMGKPLRLTGTIQDVTERVVFEEALIEAREAADHANQAKSEFLSSMSHELRTPLNAILGFGQLMAYDDDLSLDHQDNAREILKAGRHLLDLITEVLDLAKVESGQIDLSLEPVELASVVDECIGLLAPLAARGNIAMSHEVLAGATVRADRLRLKQAFLNLLSNAIKYNREGGTVNVSVRPSGAERLCLLVADTGLGIPAARLCELFEPFNRLDAESGTIEGTGIGLTITRRIVDLMDGTVSVESEVGVGSCFSIELPLGRLTSAYAAQAEPEPAGATSAGPVTGDRHTVLYIEDNPANLRLVAQILSHVPNVHLLTAQIPSMGVDLALEHRPELVLLDINMPGMDGYGVLRVFKADARLKDIPVIAITANAMPREIELGLAAGFEEYLTKPLKIDLFIASVQGCLARGNANSGDKIP